MRSLLHHVWQRGSPGRGGTHAATGFSSSLVIVYALLINFYAAMGLPILESLVRVTGEREWAKPWKWSIAKLLSIPKCEAKALVGVATACMLGVTFQLVDAVLFESDSLGRVPTFVRKYCRPLINAFVRRTAYAATCYGISQSWSPAFKTFGLLGIHCVVRARCAAPPSLRLADSDIFPISLRSRASTCDSHRRVLPWRTSA